MLSQKLSKRKQVGSILLDAVLLPLCFSDKIFTNQHEKAFNCRFSLLFSPLTDCINVFETLSRHKVTGSARGSSLQSQGHIQVQQGRH